MIEFDAEDLIDPGDFLGDYDDEPFLQDEGSTTVAASGAGVAPGVGTIPSFGTRRRKRRGDARGGAASGGGQKPPAGRTE